jgi:hypothetical protein
MPIEGLFDLFVEFWLYVNEVEAWFWLVFRLIFYTESPFVTLSSLFIAFCYISLCKTILLDGEEGIGVCALLCIFLGIFS